MIGSLRAYLSRNYVGVQFEPFVIGYRRDFHVNYARFNGFFTMFRTVTKSATDVFAQENLSKVIFNSKICYRYD